MKKSTRCAAFLTALLLLLCLLPNPALAADTTITISDAGDLVRLSESCRLDTWSRDKTVVLKADIDLRGVDFEPIPTFGGTFDGGGHTISGLNIGGEGSPVGGLFRYVQEGALVRNLHVSGTVAPQANGDSFGGIAGENSGTITGCSFDGSVSGESSTGGIVGVNRASGQVYGCTVRGSVTGGHYTGGVAGQNQGTLIRCTSYAQVNTTNADIPVEEISIDWEDLTATENAAAHTDTGGIAGYSTGVIQSCSNGGAVGYPHVGYNVGGIVGRQSGSVYDCTNTGAINGRKDVGGVVGQMVPSISLEFSQDRVSELRGQLETLRQLIDGTLTDFEDASASVTGTLSSASAYLDSARESAADIGRGLTDFVDGNVESINSFSATVARYVERLSPILEDLENFSAALTAASGCLEQSMGALNEGLEELETVRGDLAYAREKLDGAKALVREARETVSGVIYELNAALERGAGPEELIQLAAASGQELLAAAEKLSQAWDSASDGLENGLRPALEALGLTGAGLEEVTGPLEQAADHLEHAGACMTSALGALSQWTEDLGKEEPLRLTGLGADFSQAASRLDASLAGLSGELDKLNGAVASSSARLAGDLRAINDQLFLVMDAFLDLVDGSGESSGSGLFEDASDEEIFSAVQGKVSGCGNSGSVDGDVNVGGAVGSMAIEYDLDPEDDISVSGSSSVNFRYVAKAVLLDCVNSGAVTVKKNCAGGLVGRMDLGTVWGCENYGSVASASGDYVGGVAGQSGSSIRSCWVLCRLSGRDYVGGVAGEGANISGCRTLVEVDSARGWCGAVAGAVTGECEDNLFVSGSLGGVDGVSYAGKAERVSYGELQAREDAPAELGEFSLSFVADGQLVARVPFAYGGSLDEEDIPAVPEKAGCTGAWEDFDREDLTFSATIRAVYTPYTTVIACEDREGEQPLVLAEGSFLPGGSVSLVPLDPAAAGFAAPDDVYRAFTVTVTGSTEQEYRLRCLAPAEADAPELWVQDGDGWRKAGAERDGSYLVFTVSGGAVTLCLAEGGTSALVPVLAALAAALVLLAAVLLRRRSGKRRRAKADAQPAGEEKN